MASTTADAWEARERPGEPGGLAKAGELLRGGRGLVGRGAREGEEDRSGVSAGQLRGGAAGERPRGEQGGEQPSRREHAGEPLERAVAGQDEDRGEATLRQTIGQLLRLRAEHEHLRSGSAPLPQLLGRPPRRLGVGGLGRVDHRDPPGAGPEVAHREGGEDAGLLPSPPDGWKIQAPATSSFRAKRLKGPTMGTRASPTSTATSGSAAGEEPGDDREDGLLPEQVPGRGHAVGPIGVVAGHHELHPAAVDAAAAVERVEPSGEHRPHGKAHVRERTGGGQDRPDAERVRGRCRGRGPPPGRRR